MAYDIKVWNAVFCITYLEHFLRVSEKTLNDISVGLCESKKEALPDEVWQAMIMPNQPLSDTQSASIFTTVMKCGYIFLLEDLPAYLPMGTRFNHEIEEGKKMFSQFRNKYLSSLPSKIQTALALARQEMIEFMKKHYGWVKQPLSPNTRF